jgi:FKBP-type peptidyl-prolyl cis-trans isomerase (trigger factor)
MPVAQAEIKEIISENPLKIKIHIEVFPEIIIDSKYKKIKIKKQTVVVSDMEVENALKEIETKFTKFEESTDKKTVAEM